VKRLVVTVHGIRTFGQWQERLQALVQEANPAIEFVHYHYGYFSVVAFLLPPLRFLATLRFRRHLRRLRQIYPDREISIVSHSFGTHLTTWGLMGLRRGSRPRLKHLILAGSVLKTTFPWGSLLDAGSVETVVNDCGIHDSILLLSQLFVLFTGMAGRTGFSGLTGRRLVNRYFEGGHSHYFLNRAGAPHDDFLRANWVPLLAGDSPPHPADERTVRGPLQGVALTLMQVADPIKLLAYATLLGLLAYKGYLEPRREAVLSQTEDAIRLARSELEQNTAPESGLTRLAAVVDSSPRTAELLLELRYGLQRLVHIGELLSGDGFYHLETEAGATDLLRWRARYSVWSEPKTHKLWLDARHEVVFTLVEGVFSFYSVRDGRRPFWRVDITHRPLLVLALADERYGQRREIGDREGAVAWTSGPGPEHLAVLVRESGARDWVVLVFDLRHHRFDGAVVGQAIVMIPRCDAVLPALPFMEPHLADGNEELRRRIAAQDPDALATATSMVLPALDAQGRIATATTTLGKLLLTDWRPRVSPHLEASRLKTFELSLQACEGATEGWAAHLEPYRRAGAPIPYAFPLQRDEGLLWALKKRAVRAAVAPPIPGFRVLEDPEVARLRAGLSRAGGEPPAAPSGPAVPSGLVIETDRSSSLEGAHARRLLLDGLAERSANLQARAVPGGMVVVWSSEVKQFGIRQWAICRTPSDGAAPRCLTLATDDYGDMPAASPDGSWMLFRGSTSFLGTSIALLDTRSLKLANVPEAPVGAAIGRAFDRTSSRFAVFTEAGELWLAPVARPSSPLLHRYFRPSSYQPPEHPFLQDYRRSDIAFVGSDLVLEYAADVFARIAPEGRLLWISRQLPLGPSGIRRLATGERAGVIAVYSANAVELLSAASGALLSRPFDLAQAVAKRFPAGDAPAAEEAPAETIDRLAITPQGGIAGDSEGFHFERSAPPGEGEIRLDLRYLFSWTGLRPGDSAMDLRPLTALEILRRHERLLEKDPGYRSLASRARRMPRWNDDDG
jgi:hypothetical protein